MIPAIVSIHQPNYLPWMGYFYKIAHCNIFVLLDIVQFSKNNYQNRVQIRSHNGEFWLTQPVRTKGKFKIRTDVVEFADSYWMEKHRKTIIQSYRKHPFFRDLDPLLDIFETPEEHLSAFNGKAIRLLSEMLSLQTRIVTASGIDVPEADDATDRLVNIVNSVHGNAYLSGSGGRKYHSEARFEKANIRLLYSDFSATSYSQAGSEMFIPGLSIIDAICNLGLTKVSNMLNQENI